MDIFGGSLDSTFDSLRKVNKKPPRRVEINLCLMNTIDAIILSAANNCRRLGGAEQQGFVCIFRYAENIGFTAVKPSVTKLPPAAWILFSNPAA